jgi:probable phosphoglycerate mutase
VETDQALDEIDYGSWTGSRPADLEGDQLWQAWNSLRGTHRVPGGESMHEVQARMVAASERLARRLPAAACVLVSHQDPLRALLVHWLGMPLDFLLRLDLAPGSLTTIDLQGGWPRLVNLNIRF